MLVLSLMEVLSLWSLFKLCSIFGIVEYSPFIYQKTKILVTSIPIIAVHTAHFYCTYMRDPCLALDPSQHHVRKTLQ